MNRLHHDWLPCLPKDNDDHQEGNLGRAGEGLREEFLELLQVFLKPITCCHYDGAQDDDDDNEDNDDDGDDDDDGAQDGDDGNDDDGDYVYDHIRLERQVATDVVTNTATNAGFPSLSSFFILSSTCQSMENHIL